MQINSKPIDEQNSLSSDSNVNKKNLNAQEESKITHKKAIFVGVLISLARKRMKWYRNITGKKVSITVLQLYDMKLTS